MLSWCSRSIGTAEQLWVRTYTKYDTTYWRRDGIMAAPLLGRIEEFDRQKGDWSLYVERLENFFAANKITEADRKRDVFLTVIGEYTYKVLRSLLSPVKPKEKSFQELVEKLAEHFSPAPSEIVERFKFHSRFRKPGESVSNYIAQLRSLAEHCN